MGVKLQLLVVLVGLIAALEAVSGAKFTVEGLDDDYESVEPIAAPESVEPIAAPEGPDYILNYVEKDNTWFDNTRNALLSLEIPANVQITKEVLEKAFDEAAAKKNVYFKYVKRNLLILDEWKDCSFEVVDSFLAILSLKELERFRSFFENYWWEKFQKCEKRETPSVISWLNGIKVYRELKEFLSAAMNLKKDDQENQEAPPAMSDEEYYAILRGVDLNDAKYKNEASMKVVQDHYEDWDQVDDDGLEVKVEDDVKYVKFLTKKCYLAFNNLHLQFAVINLTKRFEQAKNVELQSNGLPFNILNEWNRICLGWLKGGDAERKALMAKSINEKLGRG